MSATRAPLSSLAPYLIRGSPYAAPNYQPDAGYVPYLRSETRVLLVGAGGLGCEFLKCLALTPIVRLHVIDLDTIDVSNLNRQFLFREADCGRSKAEVACEAIRRRCPWMELTFDHRALQELELSFYQSFDVIIAGLDNVEARSYLNGILIQLVRYSPVDGSLLFDSVKPFIDGGTEGFAGQARLFLPRVTSCFDCSLSSMPQQRTFPSCTIRNVPRLPEHCIVYALKVLWPRLTSFTSSRVFTMRAASSSGDADEDEDEERSSAAVTLDKDDVEHMTWLYEQALNRAQQFHISGVTYALTMQVVKHIIPAIASTNALIAAACANEVWKYVTKASLHLNNYFMFMGGQSTGTHCETFSYARNPQCSACQSPLVHKLSNEDGATMTLRTLIQQLTDAHSLDRPSLMMGSRALYIQTLHDSYAAQLDALVNSLIPSGQIISVSDKAGNNKQFVLVYQSASSAASS